MRQWWRDASTVSRTSAIVYAVLGVVSPHVAIEFARDGQYWAGFAFLVFSVATWLDLYNVIREGAE